MKFIHAHQIAKNTSEVADDAVGDVVLADRVVQPCRRLGHRDHEAQVEEQLQRGRDAVLLVGAPGHHRPAPHLVGSRCGLLAHDRTLTGDQPIKIAISVHRLRVNSESVHRNSDHEAYESRVPPFVRQPIGRRTRSHAPPPVRKPIGRRGRRW